MTVVIIVLHVSHQVCVCVIQDGKAMTVAMVRSNTVKAIYVHHKIDTNECDNSPCDHNCINTDGSYYCTCYSDGYQLDTDGLTCRGKKVKHLLILFIY